MTSLKKAIEAVRADLEAQAAKSEGFVSDGDDGLILDGVFDLSSIARAVLMAVQDMPVSFLEEAAKQAYGADPLPHEVMNFDSAWTAALDAILNEGQP